MSNGIDLRVVTKCSECGFAEVDGGVQVGCKTGTLTTRQTHYGDSVEQGEDGFFRLHGFVCLHQRSPEWVAAKRDEAVATVYSEVAAASRQTCAVVIFVGPGKGLEDVETSIASLAGSSDYVQHVSIVLNNAGRSELIRFGDYAANHMTIDGVHPSYDVYDLAPDKDRVRKFYEGRHFLRAVDEGVVRTKQLWYTAAEAGYAWPEGVFAKLNRVVVDENNDTLCIGPQRKSNGFFVVKMFHDMRKIGGNLELMIDEKPVCPIYKKAKLFAEDIGRPSFYKSWKEFKAL